MRPLASVTSRTGGALGVRTCGTESVDRKPRVRSSRSRSRHRAGARLVRAAMSASALSAMTVAILQRHSGPGAVARANSQATVSTGLMGSLKRNRTFVRAVASEAARQCNNRMLTALSCGRTFHASAVMATWGRHESGARRIARECRESSQSAALKCLEAAAPTG